MEDIGTQFPHGIEYSIPYDTTLFVKVSIHEVVKTIFEAGVLVALVVFVFLQNIRLTIIPVVAMIISIVGAFAGMLIIGLSINSLTLFAMVLAIGIVVDDAIVVIENVEHNMRVLGKSSKEAAYQAMSEVTGPVIAIVLVLCSVFIPVAFLGGIAGQLYKQFALTISISVVISGIVALTLSPALSAILIKPQHTKSTFSLLFDKVFGAITALYERGARWLIVRPFIGIGAFCAFCLTTLLLFKIVPTAFIPNEDQGYLIGVVNMPEGSSLNRTEAVSAQTEQIAMKNPAMDKFIELAGYSFIDSLNRTNQGTNFLVLKDWDKRRQVSERADSVQRELARQYYQIPQANVLLFNPPAIQGLGTVGGFEFWIENRGEGNYASVEEVTKAVIAKAGERPELMNVTSTIDANAEQLYIDLDRAKARSLGVPINNIYSTLQSLFGSYYVNNFNKYGRVYRVMIMAQPRTRAVPNDIEQIYVKSVEGKLVPLSALVNLKNTSGTN